MGFIHDECQLAVRDGLEEEFGKMVVECARRSGEFFSLRCPVDAEYKIGKDWAECH
jgi:DNA polymerase I-like protein with 3'-5' exonuclease and polymerase domains